MAKKKKRPAASVSQNTFYSPMPICKRQCSLCAKQGDKCAGTAVQAPQPGPAGLATLPSLATAPLSPNDREAKNGKMVKQGFHFDLSDYIPETEPRVENTFPFLHLAVWSDFSSLLIIF